MKKIISTGLLLFLLFAWQPAAAQKGQLAEVFDIRLDHVTKTMPVTPAIQKEAESYLQTITGLSPKLSPIPKEGRVIKVPLEPAVPVQNQWIDAVINEVIIIIGKHEPPALLVFDDENKAYFFYFNKDIGQLLRIMDEPRTDQS